MAAGTSLGRLVIDLAANAAGFESDLKRASKAAQREMAKVSRELRFAQRDLDAANSKLSGMATRIAALGAVSLAVVAREFKKLGDEADRIQKLSIATGLSAEAIQELGFAAEQSGSNLESVIKGVQQLQKNIVQAQDGLATYTRAFERVGIAVEDLDGLSQEEQFLRMAQALSEVDDPTIRTATAMELLGRAGKELIPFLAQGADGIEVLREQLRSTGSVMGQDTVNAAAQFNDAINLLTRQAGALKVALFSDIIQPLADVVDFFARAEEGQEALREGMGRLADVAKNVGIAVGVILAGNFLRLAIQAGFAAVNVGVATAAKIAAKGATDRLALSVGVLTGAFRVLTGPIGIIITVFGTLALGYREIRALTDQASEATKDYDEQLKRLTQTQAQAAQAPFLRLFNEIEAETISTIRAINDLEMQLEEVSQFEGTLDALAPDIQKELDATIEKLGELQRQSKEVRERMNEAGEQAQQFADNAETLTGATDDSAESAKKMADAIQDLRDEIADASAELAGPLARNLRNFQREVQRIAQLPVPEALKAERIALLREEFDRTNIEIRDGLIRTFEDAVSGAIPAFIAGMLGIGDAARVAAEDINQFTVAGQRIGQNITGALINGQGLGDSIGSALTAFGQEPISEAVGEAFGKAFEGLGDSKAVQDGIAVGSLALGQALSGDIAGAVGSGLGAALGSVIPGVGSLLGAGIGSALSSLIGGLFSNDTPRFELFSLPGGSNLQPGRSDFFDTIFGEQAVRFRDFGDEAEGEFILAFQELDRTVASILSASLRRSIDQSSFEFDSRVGDANIEDIFEDRVAFFVDQLFDSAIAGFVRGAGDIDAQIQRIADVFAIENQLLLGRGFGLAGLAAPPVAPGLPGPIPPGFGGGGGGGGTDPGRQPRIFADGDVGAFRAVIQGTGDAAGIANESLLATLQLLEELAFGTESLQETFARLTTVVDSLDRVAGLTGNQIADSREGLVRFGAELVEIFGNDAQAFAGQLNRALGAIFSDDELLNQTISSARQQIANLLGSIGVEVNEAVFTAEGFREVFESLFGTVGPEETAALIEAGAALADLIEAEKRLADARSEATEDLTEQLRAFERQIDDSIFEALADDFRIAFRDIGRDFESLRQRADELGASQQTLDRIERLRVIQLNQLIASVRASLEDLTQLLFGDTDQQVRQINRVSQARDDAFEKELRALNRIADFIDSVLLSGVSPLTPGQRVREARDQLEEAFAAAGMGDISALENLPQLADQFFREFQQFTGGVGEFPAEFDDIIRRLRGLQEAGPQNQPSSIRPPTALEFDSGIRRVANELTELQRVSSTFALVDQLGLMAQLTGRAPSDIAAELGIPLGRVIETLTGEVPGLIGDDLAGFFDALVSEANQQLNELNVLESLATQRNDFLKQILLSIQNLEQPPPQFAGPVEPGPGGTINGSIFVPPPTTVTSTGNNQNDLKAVTDKLERIERVLADGNADRRDQTGEIRRLPDELSRGNSLRNPSRGSV